MAGLSTLVTLGGHPKIYTLCTICKYVFLAFLEDLAIVFPPTITRILPSGALGLFSARRLGSGSLGRFSLPLINCYLLPHLDEGFDLLLEVIAFGSVMLMVSVEVIVLILGPFI